MKLFDFLKEYGLFANELRTRLQNKQILVNGVSQPGDYDLGNVVEAYDQGFFLSKLYKLPSYELYKNQIMIFGLDSLMSGESNIQNELTDFLKDYKMIVISKENAIFIKTSEGEQVDNILFQRETKGKFSQEIEKPKQIDNSEMIAKLQSDKIAVEKQLSNKGFVNNAPKFKVEQAQRRLENIIKKLQELGVNESVIVKFKDFE